jgi:uncharacterized integral membrane protein
MRFLTVLKIIFGILLVTLIVIFCSQNTAPVKIQHPFGHSESFGLIHVIVFSFLLGAISGVFFTLIINAKLKGGEEEESEDLVDDD